MKQTISLNGLWTLSGTDESGAPLTLPIRIPDYVIPTLVQAGLLPDVYYRDNAKLCQWVEEREWRFSLKFDLPEGVDIRNARLRFESVDTFATYELNGTVLGESKNVFLPVSFEVGALLREADNELTVTVHPWRECIGEVPSLEAAFTNERVHIRRTQCTFFWDWVERFVSAGIAGKVELIFPDKAEISDVSVVTRSLPDGYASLALTLETSGARACDARYDIAIIDPDGACVWSERARVYLGRITRQADIPNPRLWWPLGYGDQPLYTLRVRLLTPEGEALDERECVFGIRTAQLFYPRDAVGSHDEQLTMAMRKTEDHFSHFPELPTHTGEGMIILVNGVRIYGKGGNWVPPTPFPGANDEAVTEHLVEMAAGCNANFLRVWGGGVYGSETFYRACDRLGVMVSQDFMFSCGTYPYQNEEFLALVEEEARYNVRRLRNHPSLIFWSGNNENCDGYDFDDPNEPTLPMAERVLIPVLRELDPTRDFRLGSPWGGYNNGEQTVGDNHGSYWWVGAETINVKFFNDVSRFNTESPYSGYALPSTMRHFLKEEDYMTDGSDVFEYHIKNNDYFTEVLKWPSVHGRLIRNSEILLGKPATPTQRLYRRAYVQYEWSRFTVEGARRSKWHNAAMQYWMYNDCWPAVGYATVDFYGKPKAGWYSSKRVFAPLAASVTERDGELCFYTFNDTREDHKLSYRVTLYDSEANAFTTLSEGETLSRANENRVFLTMPVEDALAAKEKKGIMLCDLYEDGRRVERARWYPSWLSEVQTYEATVSVSHDIDARTVTLTCTDGLALGVALDADALFEEGFFDLCAGESMTVAYRPLPDFDTVTPYAYNARFVGNT